MTDFDQIFGVLAEANVRFIVVGGVAVVLQGHPRLTADVDLVLSLERDNVLAALRALAALEYRPQAPFPAEDFADPAKRREWIDEKGMVVFSLWSPRFPVTEVDLFVSEPFPFDEMWHRASKIPLGQTTLAVASVEDLISMKESAARPKDLTDADALRKLLSDRGGGSGG